MKQTDPQYKLRIPAELKARIDEAAKGNHRSINAEIIARLEASIDAEVVDFALATPKRSTAGTSFAPALALGSAESLLEAARAAFREREIAHLTDQLIAEIELTVVRGEGSDFEMIMTKSIGYNIERLASLKETEPLQEYATLMEAVEKRLDESLITETDSGSSARC